MFVYLRVLKSSIPEMMGDRDQSYGTMALQALVAGGDLEDEDDSDDSANLWDAEDDEEDDEDDEEDDDFDDETGMSMM